MGMSEVLPCVCLLARKLQVKHVAPLAALSRSDGNQATSSQRCTTARVGLTRGHVDVLIHVRLARQRKGNAIRVLVPVHELIQVALAERVEEPGPLQHVCSNTQASCTSCDQQAGLPLWPAGKAMGG